MARRTDAWPTVVHPCAGGELGVLRFTGTAKDGAEQTCPRCFITYRYTKPKPRGGYRPPPTGPGVSHF